MAPKMTALTLPNPFWTCYDAVTPMQALNFLRGLMTEWCQSIAPFKAISSQQSFDKINHGVLFSRSFSPAVRSINRRTSLRAA
jgi:hypothetical protein